MPLSHEVQPLYLGGMTKLQTWMTANGKRDPEVAAAVGLSRVQISRLRRGLTGASPAAAKRLARLTKIKWWFFVDRPDGPRVSKAERDK